MWPMGVKWKQLSRLWTFLPPLPSYHRDYEGRNGNEVRIRTRAENQWNAKQRHELTVSAWKEVYSSLEDCTVRAAPMLN